jgi:hypothetical protein
MCINNYDSDICLSYTPIAYSPNLTIKRIKFYRFEKAHWLFIMDSELSVFSLEKKIDTVRFSLFFSGLFDYKQAFVCKVFLFP